MASSSVAMVNSGRIRNVVNSRMTATSCFECVYVKYRCVCVLFEIGSSVKPTGCQSTNTMYDELFSTSFGSVNLQKPEVPSSPRVKNNINS